MKRKAKDSHYRSNTPLASYESNTNTLNSIMSTPSVHLPPRGINQVELWYRAVEESADWVRLDHPSKAAAHNLNQVVFNDDMSRDTVTLETCPKARHLLERKNADTEIINKGVTLVQGSPMGAKDKCTVKIKIVPASIDMKVIKAGVLEINFECLVINEPEYSSTSPDQAAGIANAQSFPLAASCHDFKFVSFREMAESRFKGEAKIPVAKQTGGPKMSTIERTMEQLRVLMTSRAEGRSKFNIDERIKQVKEKHAEIEQELAKLARRKDSLAKELARLELEKNERA